ncbi:helix-turn-helix transcriptional regulator [Phyllobacterium sp. 628]|uniref:helix-turn-helix transcriptional regulator n=1 Tax=Phyllobacterium sp. 628 TaxID=2718938 RepID=UPI001662218C|nr:helix-turn-helix transcriptional regulator [Phyllobacterium sp. 628]QND52876.1 helix-turn-helix transcriptional regulator [Phyllobacterium sp. 628]
MYDNSGECTLNSLSGKQREAWQWPAHTHNQNINSYRHHGLTLLQTSILHGETIESLEVLSNGASSTLSFIFMLKGALELVDTKSRKIQIVKAGTATKVIDHTDIKARIHPGSAWIIYRVPLPTLRVHFERLMRRPYIQDSAFAPLYEFRAGGATALYQTLCHVSEDLSSATHSMREAFNGVYERLLLAKLVMTRPDTPGATSKSGIKRIAPRSVTRAEAFMRANMRTAITLDQIADAAGCSPRALQHAFKEHWDKTPMQLLCEYRLSMAYDAILGGNVTSMADLAFQLCFSSPSRFSLLYRNAYGTSPSDMIRFRDKHI